MEYWKITEALNFLEENNMPMDIQMVGEQIKLKREQWRGNCAYISNYPTLLDAVQEYTWTYTER